MAEEKYISDLTGEELDAALRNIGKIQSVLAEVQKWAEIAKANAEHPIGYIFEWAPVSGQDIDLSTSQKVADYFGYGTWEEYAPGKVLAAKNANHAVGTSVGAESHVMTLSELVPHKHGIDGWQIGTQDFGGSTGLTTNAYPLTFNNFAPTTKSAGSGTAMSLMQPTQYVYRWQRIA